MPGSFFAQNLHMDTIQTLHGNYRVLYAPGGRLTEAALASFHDVAETGSDLIYADQTVHFHDGRTRTVAKPDWSPDTLLSMNYIDSPIAVREALLPPGSADAFCSPEGRYALTLYLTERAGGIAHIDQSLYSGPAEPPCGSSRPVLSALRRRRVRGAYVEHGALPGSFAVRYPVPADTRVSVVVYGGGSVRHVRGTLEDIATRCCWPHMELLVADNGCIEAEKERYYAALKQNRAAIVMRGYNRKSTAKLLNEAAAMALGDVLLFLPAGASMRAFDAVERMLELALRPHICAVGVDRASGKSERIGVIHNVRIVEDVMMTRKDRFFSAGGFDETFSEAGYMRAYTLLHADGRMYNVITPFASCSLPSEAQADERDIDEVNRMRLADLDAVMKR